MADWNINGISGLKEVEKRMVKEKGFKRWRDELKTLFKAHPDWKAKEAHEQLKEKFGISLSSVQKLWSLMKKRSWPFMFLGLLSPIGLLSISLLKDKSV